MDILLEEGKERISTQLKSLFDGLDVNFINCCSNSLNADATLETIKEGILNNKERVVVDLVHLSNKPISKEDLPGIVYKQEHLDKIWQNAYSEIVDPLNFLAVKGENRLELRVFIQQLLEEIDRRIFGYNLNHWKQEKRPADLEALGAVQIFVEEKYQPISYSWLDLQKMEVIIENNFRYRRLILQDLLYKLVKICCNYLLIPSAADLPVTNVTGNKLDIFEILVFIESVQIIDDFESFKAIFLALLGMDAKEYSQRRSDIVNRKRGKFQFIKRNLIAMNEGM